MRSFDELIASGDFGDFCYIAGRIEISAPYESHINDLLVDLLHRLVEAGGVAKTNNITNSYSQKTNISILRHWELITQPVGPNGRYRSGWWQITSLGREFIEGNISIYETVLIHNGKRIEFRGNKVFYSDVDRKLITKDEIQRIKYPDPDPIYNDAQQVGLFQDQDFYYGGVA